MTAALVDDLIAFRDARGWARHHTPRQLAEALSVEAGELLNEFLWGGQFQQRSPMEAHAAQVGEVADILIYAYYLCVALEVSPEAIVQEKMRQNVLKYPAPEPTQAIPAHVKTSRSGAVLP